MMDKLKKDKFRLIGLKLPHKTINEGDQSNVDCGNLWQKFEREHVFEKIPNKLTDEIFSVYYDYEKDETKPFSYFIGCKVKENTPTPSGLNDLRIPAQYYMKITAKGAMTDCITEAWKKIWELDINRNFTFDFEIYDEKSKDWNNAELDIFIATDQ